MALYIVSTPIGNLKDITLRALETLKEAEFILCEDTRVTGNLLKHFEIEGKELISLNAFNEKNKVDYVINRLHAVEIACLVSDAGTPGISDPGLKVISSAIEDNIEVISIPGPSAAISALTLSGFPTDSFVFEGFLPQKKGRQKFLKGISAEERTIILYESVYRIEKLLSELNEYMPNRKVAVCREITKKFEEVWRGTPNQIISNLNSKVIKGEFVVILDSLRNSEKELSE